LRKCYWHRTCRWEDTLYIVIIYLTRKSDYLIFTIWFFSLGSVHSEIPYFSSPLADSAIVAYGYDGWNGGG
jgi:hypothetical protein